MLSPLRPIRFCRSRDGARIAYSVSGEGPVLIKAANLASDIESELEHPVLGGMLEALGRGRRLVRYDARGFGLSDRDVADLSLERQVEDLGAVAAAVGAPRYSLVGMAGGSVMALRHTAAHPGRVHRLVIYGGFLVGRTVRCRTEEDRAEAEALIKLVEIGWGKDDPSFRQLYTSQYVPHGTAEQFRSLNELLRRSATAHTAAQFVRVLHASDQSAVAPAVRCPALVLHARGDQRVPFAQGRLLAAALPNARFVPLDSPNHTLLRGEPALEQLAHELEAFLPGGAPALATLSLAAPLTPRESEVLEQLAQGLDNAQIGARLGMSEKTVRNHVSALFAKLDVPTRAAAIVRARDAGFGQARAERSG
jgi:pimeloyl-ACP methyl ester carboxylesterase/DNA-binding CsgD family transcriptional regulator